MRTNPSSARQGLLTAILTMSLAACASSGAPIYEYRPTESPLRYELTAHISNEIETPGGTQTSGGESDATFTASIGERTDSGTVFSVTFESFRAAASGDLGSGEVDGGAVEGTKFVAVLKDGGVVDIIEAPEIDLEGISADDLAGVVIGLLMPLPPGGADTSESWPHIVEAPVGSGLDGSSAYTGTARMAGDTTWNGVPAEVIVSEGKWVLTGAGTPPGSPAPIELTMEGTSSTTYYWDSARGVMLSAEASSQGSGSVATMGFEMPITNTASSTTTLQMPGAAAD